MSSVHSDIDPAKIIDEHVTRHRGFGVQEGRRFLWFRGGTEGELDAYDCIAQINVSIKSNDAA